MLSPITLPSNRQSIQYLLDLFQVFHIQANICTILHYSPKLGGPWDRDCALSSDPSNGNLRNTSPFTLCNLLYSLNELIILFKHCRLEARQETLHVLLAKILKFLDFPTQPAATDRTVCYKRDVHCGELAIGF